MSLRSIRPRHDVAAAPGPIRVKELPALAVDALVGVGAEIVALDLKEVVQVFALRLSIRRQDATSCSAVLSRNSKSLKDADRLNSAID